MTKFYVNLSNVDTIKTFVNIVSKAEFDVDAERGRYVIDAKSIMGLFSLDLSKKILIHANTYHDGDAELLIMSLADAGIAIEPINE